MDRGLSAGLEADKERDMLERAATRKRDLLAKAEYEIGADRARAIDDVVRRAERVLTA
jgi:hypothetical protein